MFKQTTSLASSEVKCINTDRVSKSYYLKTYKTKKEVFFSSVKGVRAPVSPWTRASCALSAEGECGSLRKTSKQRRRHKRGTVYLRITRSEFGAEISRPVGSCYRSRQLRIFTGRDNRVSPDSFQLWSRRGSKESCVRWGKWRCGCNFCTSFLSQNGG